jgi:hypothetical protein
MALRLNRKIWIGLFSCFQLAAVYGQYDTAGTISDSVIYEDPEAGYYDPEYHFDDSAQAGFNRSTAHPEFNRPYWEKLRRGLEFDEEKVQPKDTSGKKRIQKKKEPKMTLPGFMKYIWILVVIAILLFVIYKFLPAWGEKNLKNKKDLIIDLDGLDEEQIRSIQIGTPLEKALKAGDYRTAYRLRYLGVLKDLIERNLILYKKEKTNYEYLLQLSGLPVYEPFRLLTFSFDGIWYGDLQIDRQRYEALETHFINFNKAVSG